MGGLRGLGLAAGILLLAVAGCSRQESEWREARARDVTAAYEAYLTRFPAGTHAAEAQARIRELRQAQAWERASRLDTPEALQRYLADWPEGPNAAEARRRLAEFLRGAGSPRAPPARTPATAPGNGALPAWSIQLGAFASREAADQAWQRLTQAHPVLLGGRAAQRVAAGGPGQALWRLRVPAASEAEARAWCSQLAARGEACAPMFEAPPSR